MCGWIPGITVRGTALGVGTTLGIIAGTRHTGTTAGDGDGATIPTLGVGAGAGATPGITITTTGIPLGAVSTTITLLAISVRAAAL